MFWKLVIWFLQQDHLPWKCRFCLLLNLKFSTTTVLFLGLNNCKYCNPNTTTRQTRKNQRRLSLCLHIKNRCCESSLHVQCSTTDMVLITPVGERKELLDQELELVLSAQPPFKQWNNYDTWVRLSKVFSWENAPIDPVTLLTGCPLNFLMSVNCILLGATLIS